MMEDQSKDLMTFVCLFEKFRFRRMSFRLCNAPAIFQLLMEKVLATCRDFSAVYIDDVLVFSKSWSEHLVHVKRVLFTLKEAGLTAKPSKCQWGRSHLDYLGHRVGWESCCAFTSGYSHG